MHLCVSSLYIYIYIYNYIIIIIIIIIILLYYYIYIYILLLLHIYIYIYINYTHAPTRKSLLLSLLLCLQCLALVYSILLIRCYVTLLEVRIHRVPEPRTAPQIPDMKQRCVNVTTAKQTVRHVIGGILIWEPGVPLPALALRMCLSNKPALSLRHVLVWIISVAITIL